MRCFTDGEIRRGIVAVRLADPEIDLMDVFLLAASTPERTTTYAEDDLTRRVTVGSPELEAPRRRDR